MNSDDRQRVALELRAGRAVASGALLAGPLHKRSEWLHTWNRRFCVLTTEELGTVLSKVGAEGMSEAEIEAAVSELAGEDGKLSVDEFIDILTGKA